LRSKTGEVRPKTGHEWMSINVLSNLFSGWKFVLSQIALWSRSSQNGISKWNKRIPAEMENKSLYLSKLMPLPGAICRSVQRGLSLSKGFRAMTCRFSWFSA
jgi:hypothetical protein